MSAMLSTSSAPIAGTKDFSYASGERQTATRFGEIRRDHSSRYVLATRILKNHFGVPSSPLRGLDLFCGNGYGTWLAASELNAHVLGVDGSEEAIRAANQHYSTARTIYSAKCFPFDLPSGTYDFITCFESIEHVQQPEGLFAALVDSLKPGGVLFVSTPNEAAMPFSINAKWFRHHVRHFTDDEMVAFARSQTGVTFAGRFGQRVYRLDEKGRVLGIDESLDMLPSSECEGAHFFIHVYVKNGSREQPAPEKSSDGAAPVAPVEGSDTFTPGIVDAELLDRTELMLDVGCGEAGPQRGFVGVDIRRVRGVGILSQAWTLERFLAPETVSAFYSRHTLEHLTYPQVRNTFASWFRLLRPGGRVHILVPDLAFHIAQFLDPNVQGPSPANPKWTQRQHALAGFYGWQREADHKLWDVHKSGFTTEIMGELLTGTGFVRYTRRDNRPWHLDVEAYKPL